VSAVGSLVVDLIAQTASFNANIEKAAANLNSNAARMNRSLASIHAGVERAQVAAKGLAAAFVGSQIIGAANRALDYASSLGEVSQQLGVTSKDLQVYRFIATQVGISQDEMDKGLQKLTASLGQAKLGAAGPAKAFEALDAIIGKDIVASSKTAGDAIPLIADALKKVSDVTQRGAVEHALFGKSGQQFDTLLASGKQAIDDYAASAERLGYILTDNQINKADRAKDKMAELNKVLEANFARTVADNADSLYALANGLEALTGKITRFLGSNPQSALAIIGGLSGAAFGGPIGLGIGAVGGYIAGDQIAAGATDADNNLHVRMKELQKARAQYHNLLTASDPTSIISFHKSSGARNGGTLEAAAAEYRRQIGLLTGATSAALRPHNQAKGATLGNFLGSPEHSKLQPEMFANQSAQLDAELLRLKQQQATDADTIARFAKEQINVEADKFAQDVKLNVAAGHLTQAQGKELLAKNETVRNEELLRAELERQRQNAQDALDLATAANDNQRDILQAQGSIATTAAARRAIELRLLDLDKQEEKAKLEAVLADQLATKAEKDRAQQRLNALDSIYGARLQSTLQSTAGPLENYFRSLPRSIDEVGEAMQRLRVDQLESLNRRTQQFASDFSDAFGRAAQDLIDLKNPFDVLKNLVSDLAHQFQQEFIVDPIKNFVHDKIAAPLSERLVTDKIGGQTVHGIASPYGLDAQQMSVAMKTSTADLIAFSQAIQNATSAALGNSFSGSGLLGSNDILSGGTSGPLIGLDGQPTGAGMTSLIDMEKLKAANDSIDLLGTSSDRAAAAMAAQVPVLDQFGSGITQILASLAGGSSGGGGFLGGLLKLGGSLLGGLGGGAGAGLDLSSGFLKAAGTNIASTIPITQLDLPALPGFASGGRPTGPSWVGENGKELFIPDAPGTIVPHGQSMAFERAMRNLRPADGSRAAMPPVQIHFHGNVDERSARTSGKQAAAAYQRELAKAGRTGMFG